MPKRSMKISALWGLGDGSDEKSLRAHCIAATAKYGKALARAHPNRNWSVPVKRNGAQYCDGPGRPALNDDEPLAKIVELEKTMPAAEAIGRVAEVYGANESTLQRWRRKRREPRTKTPAKSFLFTPNRGV